MHGTSDDFYFRSGNETGFVIEVVIQRTPCHACLIQNRVHVEPRLAMGFQLGDGGIHECLHRG